MDWSQARESREQLVLFPTRLDDAIGIGHRVRVLDEILRRLDWSTWEAKYNLRRGQPPIHPRILASVILYGILVRIRSSRALEEALQVRLDFRWLVEGRSIDHTTISEFRRKHPDALKETFVQIGLVARELGCLPLETLAFDGTRMRSNNRRSGSRTPDELRAMKQELAETFAELESRVLASDDEDNERFGEDSAHTLSQELADAERRQQQVDAALDQLKQLEAAGQTIPKRIPITDPESRIMPNKDGGHAPNYTPTATVDVDSGIIVAGDVLNQNNEDDQLVPSIESVQEAFSLDASPAEALADGLMATGENLAACEERGIDLYAPVKQPQADNPALRENPSQPVAAEDYDRLPTKRFKRKGHSYEQLDKEAFVYDAAEDCYWCPAGKRLSYRNRTSEKTKRGKQRHRRRYKASPSDCAECPLKSLCLAGTAQKRTVNRQQHESLREAHTTKMSTEKSRAKYRRRGAFGERPFATIKFQFGVRQFLVRGLAGVRQEWTWLLSAANLDRLIGLIASGKDPPVKLVAID